MKNRLEIENNLELMGTLLRELRLKLNLTQKDVSAATGLHINTVSNVERGHSCRFDNFIAIANFFDLKPSEILSVMGW